MNDKTAIDFSEFREARRVSKNSDMEVKVGAVITKGNRRLSAACNKDGTIAIHPKKTRIAALQKHAEVMAVFHAGPENVKGATIWVWRETKKGDPVLARPCNVDEHRKCLPFLRLVGIKRIKYTIAEYPYFKEEKL